MICEGHRLEDILEYTWGQFITFQAAVSRVQRERAMGVYQLHSAVHTSDKDFKDSWFKAHKD